MYRDHGAYSSPISDCSLAVTALDFELYHVFFQNNRATNNRNETFVSLVCNVLLAKGIPIC